MRFPNLRVVALVVLAPSLCLGAVPGSAREGAGKTTPAAKVSPGGFDKSDMDTSVLPCDDFYQFANGGWITKNAIPAEYPSWGAFEQLQERNLDVLHSILEDLAKDTKAPKGSLEQKLGDFYATAMDTARIDAEGAAPLKPELDRIAAVADVPTLVDEVARLHVIGPVPFFNFGSTPDAKNSTQVVGGMSQGGLGLPDRDYYLQDDPKMVTIRDAYVTYMTNIFKLLGDTPEAAAANAKTVLAVETALAKPQMPRIERRNPDNIYHKFARADLGTFGTNIPWERYFQAVGAPAFDTIIVSQPDYIKALDQQIVSTPIADLKQYLRWRFVSGMAQYLSSAFVDERFKFTHVITGEEELSARWKRAVNATDNSLGELLGQAYVKRAFTPAAKARMLEMIANLKAALRSDLPTLAWMSDATRKQAAAKLDAFTDKIGYPDKWRDYSSLDVDRSSYAINVQHANAFEWRRDVAKIGKPVDRTEWGITPPTVNAYYNPLYNEIVFPAGILQPPFFDPNADDAYNYGGIGAVIGHEMTHGFDDSGAKFDAEGNLKNWWAEADLKNFKDRAKCISDQFTAYTVQGDLHLKGDLVLGESIADLGGLTIALAAYEKSQEGKKRATVDGFTPEQRFFLGWARVWAENVRPEYERLLVNVNPHPPGRYRVNGPLSNMPAFQKAWGCKDETKMVRQGRCEVW